MKPITPGLPELFVGLLLTLTSYSMNAMALPEQIFNNNQTSSVISGSAFANSNGVIAINQAAGAANAQANSVSIIMGANKPVNNSILAQSVTSEPDQIAMSQLKNLNSVSISATAFKGAEGIAQINQVAGSGNASANSFTLGIAPGVIH